jgi:predicted mannosyl-3-phosphoglycerate phosphatase (HAD superfamily)
MINSASFAKQPCAGASSRVLKGVWMRPMEDLARYMELNLNQARLAKNRQYSETILLTGNRGERESTLDAIRREGLHCVFGGRFFEVSMGSDKGKAVKILSELFKLNYDQISTYGIGDGENDIPMFNSVDYPLLVQNAEKHWGRVKAKGLVKIRSIGPLGFSQAVQQNILGDGTM